MKNTRPLFAKRLDGGKLPPFFGQLPASKKRRQTGALQTLRLIQLRLGV